MNVKSLGFSGLNRTRDLEQLRTQVFDLLIIGGGATGCGIALDAAARGMKTALIEQNDFASGTSSKSTKLIHGGLRYLKQFEVGLVRETGTERAIVHKLAPHLVLPEKMLLPIIENGTYGKWAAALGVLVYDLLAGVHGEDRRKMLSAKDTLKIEPLLDASKLKGACLYAEYRTDDARLTIELIKRANHFGALALNYCTALDFVYDHAHIQAVQAIDHITGMTFDIRAKQVVSAAGPWVDRLRKVNQSINHKQLHLTKGIHLVFSHDKFPLQHAIYFDVPDGRMVFAIPRGKTTYVGTTDTTYTGNLQRVVTTKTDAQYILDAIRHAFPAIQLTQRDIISNWAGLRPLIHEGGKSPSELSRKDEIFESPSGLISIAGGKLTGYRKMAQRVVDLVEKRLPQSYKPCSTNKIPLVKNTLADSTSVEQYINEVHQVLHTKKIDRYHAWYLVTTYGKQADTIIKKAADFTDAPLLALIRAELWFGVHHEMVNSLSDFYVRRTGHLYFNIERIQSTKQQLMEDLAKYLKWSPTKIQEEEKQLAQLVHDATHYYEKEFTE